MAETPSVKKKTGDRVAKWAKRAGRRTASAERKADAAKRTPVEQLEQLDFRLGAGCGARRERAKLYARMLSRRA